MSDYHEGLEEGIKIGRAEATARIAELEGAVKLALLCIDADDAIAAHSVLTDATATKATGKVKWKCPNNSPGCTKNCGNYGCGN